MSRDKAREINTFHLSAILTVDLFYRKGRRKEKGVEKEGKRRAKKGRKSEGRSWKERKGRREWEECEKEGKGGV